MSGSWNGEVWKHVDDGGEIGEAASVDIFRGRIDCKVNRRVGALQVVYVCTAGL